MPGDAQVPLVLPGWLDPLQRDLERTVGRLRSRSLARLGQPLDRDRGSGPTAAAAARSLAQHLADLAAQVEGQPSRRLPDLPDHVLPDVLAVAGNDLVAALAATPVPGEPVRTPDGAALDAGVCSTQAQAQLVALRLLL